MKTVISELRIVPDDGHLLSECMTVIGLCDVGAGAFVTVSQPTGRDIADGAFCIDASEWPAIRAGIERMLAVAEGIEAGTLTGGAE